MELRWGMDGGETHTSRPAWGYNGAVKELWCNYRDLDGGDTRNAWKWDSTRKEMRCKSRDFRWSWDWACMNLRCTFCEVNEGNMWPGWRWDDTWMAMIWESFDQGAGEAKHRWRWNLSLPGWGWYTTRMEMRHDPEDAILMNRKELMHSQDGGGMQISGHGWRWDATWMAMRCEYRALVDVRRDVDGDIHISTYMGMRWDQNGGWPHMIRAGWRWYATWMEMGCEYWHLDGDEMQHGGGILIHGYCQRSDSRWMVLGPESCDLDAVDTGPGWRWKARIKFWVTLRWCLDRAEMQFSGTGCSWDVNWIGLRHMYRDLHRGETRPGWRWDVNLRGLEGNVMGYNGRGALHSQSWMWSIWDQLSYTISELDGEDTTWMEVRHEYRHQDVYEM